jgi:hypothetical protein
MNTSAGATFGKLFSLEDKKLPFYSHTSGTRPRVAVALSGD